jgi:hypothetical protein
VASWLCLLQPWRYHMGIACYSRHHNTFPAALRTQSITSTEIEKAASEAAFQIFFATIHVIVYSYD